MGFAVLFFGILIFNEIIILPFLKMKNKTRYERPDSSFGSPGMHKRSMISNGDIEPMIIVTSDPSLGGKARETARLGDSSFDNQDAAPPQ